jgi:hypothetical protein
MKNGKVTIRDFYSLYLDQMRLLNRAPMPEEEYAHCISYYFKETQRHIIRSYYHFRMPFNLGVKYVRKERKREVGRKQYGDMDHRSKYFFYISWRKDRNSSNFRNKNFYHYEPTVGDTVVGKSGLSKFFDFTASDPLVPTLDAQTF